VVGSLDATGQLRLGSAGQAAVAFDLTRESITHLSSPAPSPLA
jgi:hypothetical protein